MLLQILIAYSSILICEIKSKHNINFVVNNTLRNEGLQQSAVSTANDTTRTPHFRSSLPATALLLPVSPLSTYFPLEIWSAEKLPIPCHGWSWKASSPQRFIAGELWWALDCLGFPCLSTFFPNRCQVSCAVEHSGSFDCAVALGLNEQKEQGLYQEDYPLSWYLGPIAIMIPRVTRAISVSLVSCLVGHWQLYLLFL